MFVCKLSELYHIAEPNDLITQSPMIMIIVVVVVSITCAIIIELTQLFKNQFHTLRRRAREICVSLSLPCTILHAVQHQHHTALCIAMQCICKDYRANTPLNCKQYILIAAHSAAVAAATPKCHHHHATPAHSERMNACTAHIVHSIHTQKSYGKSRAW